MGFENGFFERRENDKIVYVSWNRVPDSCGLKHERMLAKTWCLSCGQKGVFVAGSERVRWFVGSKKLL